METNSIPPPEPGFARREAHYRALDRNQPTPAH